jgi:SPP1 gp7 family putative phage head morphogenesis protein
MNQNQRKPTRRQRDPAGTGTIINKAIAEINKAFRKLRGDINRAFTEANLFQIGDEMPALFSINVRTDAEKVIDFQTWLTTLIQAGTLQIDETGRVTFLDQEVATAFREGRNRAQQEILASTGQEQLPFPILGTGAQQQQLALVFQQITNSFAAMTATAINTMTTTLSNGLIAGLSPREMAEVLKNDLKLPLARARTIARTEIQRAHHLGNVSELEAANIEEIVVVAEWSTAKDGRVCRDCARLDGRIFTVDEIKGMIPVHPNCRCVAIPVLPGITEVDKLSMEELERIVAEDQLTKEGELKPDRGFFEERSGGRKPPGFSIEDAERRQELENEQRLNFEIKAARIRNSIKKLQENDESIADAFNDLLDFNDKKLNSMQQAIYDRIEKMVINELTPLCKPGKDGDDGKPGERGLSIKGNKGDQGDRGEKGDIGGRGERGLRGLSIKGDKGDKGEKGEKGDTVKGDKGDIPDHQMITNKNDKIIGIRFQKPDGSWGKLAKFTSRLKINNVSNLEFDRAVNPRRMRFLVRGQWTEWIKINRSGGGGIGDAPKDGKCYVRKDGKWVEISATGVWEDPEYELTQADVDNGYIDLPSTPVENSLFVYINGVYQSAIRDYSLSGNRITFISRRFSKNSIVETKYQT